MRTIIKVSEVQIGGLFHRNHATATYMRLELPRWLRMPPLRAADILACNIDTGGVVQLEPNELVMTLTWGGEGGGVC
jgi:hypothetical protein